MFTEAPFETQVELRKYKSRTTGTCPECGYVGLMGKVIVPMTRKQRILNMVITLPVTLVLVILFIKRILSSNVFFELIMAEFVISTVVQILVIRKNNYKLVCPACKKETA